MLKKTTFYKNIYFKLMNNSFENQIIEDVEDFEDLLKEEIHWFFKFINFFNELPNKKRIRIQLNLVLTGK